MEHNLCLLNMILTIYGNTHVYSIFIKCDELGDGLQNSEITILNVYTHVAFKFNLGAHYLVEVIMFKTRI